MAVWRRCCSKRWRGDRTGVLGFWHAGEEEARRQKAEADKGDRIRRSLDALRRASAASASPVKHFVYSSKTEAFASPPSLKAP
ncbi:hypothetical protein C1H46_017112 [Malus baccata]|uniref:Uncharacterized protein n=1 Tax=Malus baccata TaxID=106549 RepID=A0A540MEW1_MALBA|nr:hypothetical protein C1H46_017112 [Malus baccata]